MRTKTTRFTTLVLSALTALFIGSAVVLPTTAQAQRDMNHRSYHRRYHRSYRSYHRRSRQNYGYSSGYNDNRNHRRDHRSNR